MEIYNEDHQIEALDRLDLIIGLISEKLEGHPAIVKAGLQNEIHEAIKKLSDAYQSVGDL